MGRWLVGHKEDLTQCRLTKSRRIARQAGQRSGERVGEDSHHAAPHPLHDLPARGHALATAPEVRRGGVGRPNRVAYWVAAIEQMQDARAKLRLPIQGLRLFDLMAIAYAVLLAGVIFRRL